MNVNDLYGGKYLKASDLKGRRVPIRISDVTIAQFDDGNKMEVHFSGTQKLLLLNKTNANRIAAIHGDDTDGWIGKEIVLFPTKVDFSGKPVDAIRVEIEAPREERQQQVQDAFAPAPEQDYREAAQPVRPEPQRSQSGMPVPDDGDLIDEIPF